jgi:hypothetical protein
MGTSASVDKKALPNKGNGKIPASQENIVVENVSQLNDVASPQKSISITPPDDLVRGFDQEEVSSPVEKDNSAFLFKKRILPPAWSSSPNRASGASKTLSPTNDSGVSTRVDDIENRA